MASIAAIILLFILFAVTTYALIAPLVSVEDNLFETAQVKIELNSGNVIFDGVSAAELEPGRSVKRDFTLENKGTVEVYYRLYLENISGPMQDSLIFEIYEGNTLLFRGSAAALNRETPCQSGTPLAAGETRLLTAVIKMQEITGNQYKNGGFSFDMTADAVQVRNNPRQSFH